MSPRTASTCRSDQRAYQWLKKIVQWRVGVQWYLFILFGIPLIVLLGYSVVYGVTIFQSLLQRWPVIFTGFLPAVALTAIETGLAEEPGWRGFALPKIQTKYGPILGSLILGIFWAMWHLPNLVLQPGGLPNFAMLVVATIINGFVYTWVYNQTQGSILMAMLLHGSLNTSSRLISNLVGVTDVAQFMFQYFVISGIVFGLLMLVVIYFTRGRLGYRSTEEVGTQLAPATISE